jgi:hypothetical protein
MFIVILLFFFTNVYLWHDAATKEMNQLYIDKINTPIAVSIQGQNLNVTNRGGSDTQLVRVWVIVESSPGNPDQSHTPFPYNDVVPAGKSILISNPDPSGNLYTVVTINGNTASCSSP